VENRMNELLQALVAKKEISIGWLATFFCGGILNLTAVVWLASAVVNDVNTLKINHEKVEVALTQSTSILAAHAAEIVRLGEADKSHNLLLEDHKSRIDRISDRLDSLSNRMYK
jgi:hypothetical protein